MRNNVPHQNSERLFNLFHNIAFTLSCIDSIPYRLLISQDVTALCAPLLDRTPIA